MLFREAHEKNLHGGPQLTLYTLRRTIWIPCGLSVVKCVLCRCQPCICFDAKLLQPQMGDLTREQVVPSFAFSNCGLDFCGSFYTKSGTRTLLKTYVAIFICFSTKAVHIEPVVSLTKDDCLEAIKRFESRFEPGFVKVFLMKYIATTQQLPLGPRESWSFDKP